MQLKSEYLTISGTPKGYRDSDTASGHPVTRWFCPDCGS